uniref:Protein kinase domain-containing protein n=1 Tax=Knipowitschia caucasica TaxID=637954 RepID=A0AAV2JDM4_KNICA
MKWIRDLMKAGGSISSPFASYQLQKILGSGCFGTVALCTKDNTDQKVALKVVKDPGREMADALTFLKSLKIVHGDLKMENIMLVDHVRKPLQVKLIDFGLARPAHLVTRGTCFGALCYSAPEMAIGAPMHHALDMWALGCIAAELFLGQVLFNAKKTADLVEVIVQILGLPPREVLDSGLLTKKYFCRPDGQNWVHKSSCVPWRMKRPVPVETLDEMYTRNPNGGEDLYFFVDLVKRMLDLDAGSRIDPKEVMTHPFLNASLRAHVESQKPHLESQSSVSPCLSKPRGQKRKREDDDDEEDVTKRPEKRYRRTDQASVTSLESQSSVSPCLSKPRGQKRKREDDEDEEDVTKRPEKRYRGTDQASVTSLESKHTQLLSSLPETPEVSLPRGLKRKRENGKEGEERPDKRYRRADLV